MAQLVAHPLDVREVTSSSLVSSTNMNNRGCYPRLFIFFNGGLELVTSLSRRLRRRNRRRSRARSAGPPQVRVLYRPPNERTRESVSFRLGFRPGGAGLSTDLVFNGGSESRLNQFSALLRIDARLRANIENPLCRAFMGALKSAPVFLLGLDRQAGRGL